MHETSTLPRLEMRRILRRHKGSMKEIARRARVRPATVSKVLQRRNAGVSANVLRHAHQHATELLAEERGVRGVAA